MVVFRRALFLLAGCLLFASPAAAKEKWLELRTPHFTILTSGNEADARRWATELEQFELGLQRILPVPEQRLSPVTVVLFRSDAAMRPYKPLEKGKPQDIAGFFSGAQVNQAIALALDSDPKEIRAVIYHEAVHWHAHAAQQELPPWLDEGLAEVYSTFKPWSGGFYAFGGLVQPHLELLRRSKLMPVGELTTIPHGSLRYNEGNRASLFYAESWMFVHYLLFGQEPSAMDAIAGYVRAAETAKSLPETFQAAFGRSYADMDQRLAAYLHGGTFHTYIYKMPPAATDQKWVVQAGAEGDVELALGILLMGEGRERASLTTAHLQRAAALLPGQPEPWEALGEAALLNDDETAAADYFDRAIAAGSQSYFTYFSRAAVRMHQPGAQIIGPGDASTMASDLRRAIALNPFFVSAYEGLAGLMDTLERLDAQDPARLERGLVLSPENPMIEVGLAAVDFKTGRREEGRQRLDRIRALGDKVSRPTREFADGVGLDEEWKELGEKLDGLFQERNYPEAIAAIDAVHGRFEAPRFRGALATNRRRAEIFQKIHEAVELANAGQVTAARAILRPLDSEPVENSARAEVRRLLHELETMPDAPR